MDKLLGRIALGCLVVGLVLLGVGGWLGARTTAFLDRARSVSGTVIALEGDETLHPVFRFQDSDGTTRTHRSRVGTSQPAFEVGEAVEVLYDPANPADARIRSVGELWLGVLIAGGMGGVFTLIGGGILGVRALSARSAAALRRTGARVQARFQSVERNTALEVNGRNPWRIVCQWQDPATGALHLFRSQNLWFDPTAFLSGRTELTVFVDRRNPKRHAMDVQFLPKLAA